MHTTPFIERHSHLSKKDNAASTMIVVMCMFSGHQNLSNKIKHALLVYSKTSALIIQDQMFLFRLLKTSSIKHLNNKNHCCCRILNKVAAKSCAKCCHKCWKDKNEKHHTEKNNKIVLCNKEISRMQWNTTS